MEEEEVSLYVRPGQARSGQGRRNEWRYKRGGASEEVSSLFAAKGRCGLISIQSPLRKQPQFTQLCIKYWWREYFLLHSRTDCAFDPLSHPRRLPVLLPVLLFLLCCSPSSVACWVQPYTIYGSHTQKESAACPNAELPCSCHGYLLLAPSLTDEVVFKLLLATAVISSKTDAADTMDFVVRPVE